MPSANLTQPQLVITTGKRRLWSNSRPLPQGYPSYVAKRKKVPDLFSDETNGNTITEFIAQRPHDF